MPEQTIQEKNKAIVARFTEDFWVKCKPNIVEELCSDDLLSDYPRSGPRRGKEATKQLMAEFRESFPSIWIHPYGPIPMVVEADYVVVRWIGGGRHITAAFGNVPAGQGTNAGRDIHFLGATVFILRDGKIVEETGEQSALAAIEQLGFFPSSS